MITQSDHLPSCAECPIPVERRICRKTDGKGPLGCPSLGYGEKFAKVESIYTRPEIREFARQASIQEAEGYAGREVTPYVKHPVKPRLQEIIEFVRRMGYRRLGLAFCTGLQKEARLAVEVFRAQELEVVSVICKVGAVPKESIGVRDEQKNKQGHGRDHVQSHRPGHGPE